MEIKAKTRDLNQKTSHLIKEGNIPAVLYGKGIENIPLVVNGKEFENILKEAGESTVIDLVLERDNKKETHPVIIYSIQDHYLTHKPIHIDFYKIKKGQKIRTHIPIEFIGEAPAVKNLGGILVKNMNEIEVEATSQDLPHNFMVDVSILDNLDSKICLKDLKISDKIKIFASPDTVIAAIVLPQEEVEGPQSSVNEVKIETEEEKAQRQEEKESD